MTALPRFARSLVARFARSLGSSPSGARRSARFARYTKLNVVHFDTKEMPHLAVGLGCLGAYNVSRARYIQVLVSGNLPHSVPGFNRLAVV